MNASTHIMAQRWLPHCKYEPTAIMLNGHIDPTYLPLSTKTEPTATATSCVISKYIPGTNMALKCYVYANYFICTYETTMSVHTPHIKSMQSIM